MKTYTITFTETEARLITYAVQSVPLDKWPNWAVNTEVLKKIKEAQDNGPGPV